MLSKLQINRSRTWSKTICHISTYKNVKGFFFFLFQIDLDIIIKALGYYELSYFPRSIQIKFLLILFANLHNLQALELRRLPEEYRGPLHGLPISVKECYFVKGCDATAGLVRYTNSPAQEDGVMIKVFTIWYS